MQPAGLLVVKKYSATRAIFAAAAMAAVATIGCAAPGPPTPPRAGIPKAISDLTARQTGAAVVLNFTLPKDSVTGDTLGVAPDIDVFRGAEPVAGAKAQTKLVMTVPSAAVDAYLHAGKVELSDSLDAAALQRRGGLAYIVRTHTSKKHPSADSNLATIELLLAPQPPGDVHANVTETAVELSWSAPTTDISGATLAAPLSYRVYRGEINPAAAQGQDLSQTKLKTPLALIGSPTETNFRDEQITFGANYVYTVRAVVGQQPAEPSAAVESADSAPLYLTPRDIFPPSAPSGVVAAIVPGTNGQAAYVELSWEANAEADVAGYWVYRSEESGTAGQRINAQLLLSPTARDTTVAAGKRYFYRVTAVDQAENESPASAAISADVPQN